MPDDRVFANGVNGLTGRYLFEPTTLSALALRVKATEADLDKSKSAWLDRVAGQAGERHFGLPWVVDPKDPSQAGWAIVTSTDEDEAVRQSMQPLVEHRRMQLGPNAVTELGYEPGESYRDWLNRHGAAPGSVDPSKVPYYVLLVGSPQRIPFRFQYLLDVEYAVGRLNFDAVDGYRQYVDSVIAYETAEQAIRDTSVAFLGTSHDPATQMSATELVEPLALGDPAADISPVGDQLGYETHLHLGENATKQTLEELLTGIGPAGRPAMLFTATHGLGGWPAGHPNQRTHHGALVCGEWPGVGSDLNETHYLTALDLPPDTRVHGLVAFFFACYGAGTPQYDEFPAAGEAPTVIADPPFVSALPKALLSHREGGALATIGHIERAWGYSFVSEAGKHLIPFQNAMGQILSGSPVGHAMSDFNEKYAALSTSLSSTLRDIGFGLNVPDSKLAELWTERNDAQNYVVLGDPAVRLRTHP